MPGSSSTVRPLVSRTFGWFLGFACVAAIATQANAETIVAALSRAFASNPDLLSDRALVRATAQNLPIAMAGYKPVIRGVADAGVRRDDPAIGSLNSLNYPRGYGITFTQPIWDGGKARGGVDQAGAQYGAASDLLRLREQTILLMAADAYMSVMRGAAVVSLRRNHLQVLELLLSHTERRAAVGEVTLADPAQARTAVAQAKSELLAAEAELDAYMARYEVVIGKPPERLSPAHSIDSLLPKSEREAIALALSTHPAILAAAQNARAAEAGVRVAQSQLSPTVNVSGAIGQRYDSLDYLEAKGRTGLVVATLNIPIYEGGAPTASVIKSREQASSASILVESERERVRGDVRAAWAVWQRSAPTLVNVRQQLASAELALRYVREEADIGTRTTQDVINAIQTLLTARIGLINAQKDRVMSGYSLLRAIGILDLDRIASASLAVARAKKGQK
ncbi:MAG: TolC family outer membrane protein [Beijerinckiaceae bacterium]